MHPSRSLAEFKFVAIKEHARTGLHPVQMPVHGILVERDEDIELGTGADVINVVGDQTANDNKAHNENKALADGIAA